MSGSRLFNPHSLYNNFLIVIRVKVISRAVLIYINSSIIMISSSGSGLMFWNDSSSFEVKSIKT